MDRGLLGREWAGGMLGSLARIKSNMCNLFSLYDPIYLMFAGEVHNEQKYNEGCQ